MCARSCHLSHLGHVQFFAILWTTAHQAPLSMGLSRQEDWSRLPCLPPGDLPDLGVKPRSLALQTDSLLSDPLGTPLEDEYLFKRLGSLFSPVWFCHFFAKETSGSSSLRFPICNMKRIMVSTSESAYKN